MTTKIDVVAQAPYPVALDSGRHLLPGEIAKNIELTPEVESQLKLGFLREVARIPELPSTKESTQKPRANPARENQDD